MSAKLASDAKGLYVIAATPFHDDGRIDFESIDSLVDFYIRCGAQGITILGVMGEFQKLSEKRDARSLATLHQARRRPRAGRRRRFQSRHLPARQDRARSHGNGRRRRHGDADPGADDRQGGRGLHALDPHRARARRSRSACRTIRSSPASISPPSTFLRLVDDFPQIAMFKHEDMPGLPSSRRSATRATARAGAATSRYCAATAAFTCRRSTCAAPTAR